MRSDFPLNVKHSQLGTIPEPIIPVSVRTLQGYQTFDFLVDTGADCTIMPASVAPDIGIELSTLPKIRFSGIEGGSVSASIAKITVMITTKPIDITCAFSSNERCPFILGRKDLFSRYDIVFDNRRKVVSFVFIR